MDIKENYYNDDLSYSMMLDKKKNNILSINPLNEIDDKKIYKWVDDDLINNCYRCGMKFSIFYRKHHCRVCGRIFCYECSNFFENVPEELQIKPQLNQKKVRVCKNCSNKINELHKLKETIDVFELLNLDIVDLFNIRNICKTWRLAANYILSKIREIQYNLSDHVYTDFEKKILWNNRKYFIGHSQWFIRLLKSIDYEDYNTSKIKMEEIITLINKKK